MLLTGLAASAILGADGEFRCPRETRGGIVEWGGVYAQGIRLTGPWGISIEIDGTAAELGPGLTHLETDRSVLTSVHRVGSVEVTQEVFPDPHAPAVVRRLRIRSLSPTPLEIRCTSSFAPYLAPVLIEGIQPYQFEIRRRGPTVEIYSYGHALWVDSAPAPSTWILNDIPWSGGKVEAEIRELGAAFDFTLEPKGTWTLDLVLSGGVASALPHGIETGPQVLAGLEGAVDRAREVWSRWTAATPRLKFPDDPPLERAYELARTAVRALYCQPTPEITGLVAGFPWYSALWCRDLAWMLPAVLWLGDPEWVEASLSTVFRYQAAAPVPLLGATAGELPMQISPGPVFLFGTSDTSLYYPALARQYIRHTGRIRAADLWWPHLRAIQRWALAKVTPETGLFRNGGEVLAVRDASATLGEIHLGIDAFDTTIWDSTDRRDHAIDLQVLYHQAMDALPGIASDLQRLSEVPGCEVERDRIGAAVRTQYTWSAEGYLYDSLHMDGTPAARLRPNALRAVSAGLLDPGAARSIVDRAFQDDLTTPWGVRTLSSHDSEYDPQAYHDGQVWPIATAWVADAALSIGDTERGLSALHVLADGIVRENGLANECYRGDRREAFDSCFLLGFSVAPFLTTLFERLWGISLSALDGTLRLRPAFPPSWTTASLHGLRFGDGRIDLDWTKGSVTVGWSGPGILLVDGPTGSVRAGVGETVVVRAG